MKYLIVVIALFLRTISLAADLNADSTKNPGTIIQTDTTAATTIDPYEGSDDFSPGLAFFALIGIGFILLCVGAGMTLTVIGLFVIFGLIALGILSASVLIGINKKSFALGFRTFLVSASTIGGALLSGLGCWALNKILDWWAPQKAIAVGTSIGLVSGALFGFIIFYILQWLTTYLKARLNQINAL